MVTVIAGVFRTKVLAVMLGPAGIGVFNLLTSIGGMAANLAGLGVGTSAVRTVAEASGSGDSLRVARTIIILRRISIVLGILGALILAMISYPASRVTFGTGAHTLEIALLGVLVFVSVVSGSQGALIQGLRQISNLARVSIWSAVVGSILAVPLICFLKADGIVPMMILFSAIGLFFSWWYARRVVIEKVNVTWRQTLCESRSMVGLGVVFMGSNMITGATLYFNQILVTRLLGIESMGYYSAAYSLAGVYVGFILAAMGKDLFPRLAASAQDHEECNRIVNQQTEVSLLLAVPGLAFTLLAAPWVITMFYAHGFAPAAGVLCWLVWGVLGRVVCWPMGYLLIALDCRHAYFWSELASNVVNVALTWVGIHYFGLAGTGMAFAGLYLFCTILMLFVTFRVSGFRYSPTNLKLVSWMLPSLAVVLAASRWLPPKLGYPVGGVITLVLGYICARRLASWISPARLGFLARFLH